MLFRSRHKSRPTLRSSFRRADLKIERPDRDTALAEIERKMNLILDNVADIIYMLDENGYITFVNNGIRMVGLAPDDVVGMHVFELVHPEDRERARYHVNERRTGERRTRGFEVRFMRQNGNVDNGGAQPVFTITAEGQYDHDPATKITFTGTIGIAHPVGEETPEEAARRMAAAADEPSLIPICAKCKRIRDNEGHWDRIEEYLRRTYNMSFTHSICPDCTNELYPGLHRHH